jgi:glycosyltransferase involved in cell wall biosynthesis
VVTINVEGYLDSFTGQAEAARLYAMALRAAGTPLGATTLQIEDVDSGAPAESIPGGAGPLASLGPAADADVNLLCVNGIEMQAFTAKRGEAYFSRPTVGVWAWETDFVPERMLGHEHLLREIWVYSSWVRENLAAAVSTPVVTVPLPVPAPGPAPRWRPPEVPDGFLFLFSFSFLSTIERKNPLGLIEAFSRAFAPGEGPQLLIKSVNGTRLPGELERVREAADARPDVYLHDGLVGPEENSGLFEACDCYVSLHRSEGFGLTVAEAMIRGKPAIATGFSGNMDFMTPANSYPVGFELVRIGQGGAVYPAEGHWAEPDLEAAAAAMRRVWENPDEARAVGGRARDELGSRLSPERVGAEARRRLERLAGPGKPAG